MSENIKFRANRESATMTYREKMMKSFKRVLKWMWNKKDVGLCMVLSANPIEIKLESTH